MRNKKLIGALTVALAGTLALGLAACGGGKTEVHDDILNGGFENGFKGWTKSGAAFTTAGVIDTDLAGREDAKVTAGKAGEYFFSGFDSGSSHFTGTLTSDPFKLGGTGKVGFLMGGGMDKENCYVEFFEQGNNTALAKVSNEAFASGYVTDELVRVVVDLSAYIGKTVYIKITDNDKGDPEEYAYLNLDDFVVYKTDADVAKAEKERSDKLALIGKPAFSETETDNDIKNGNFEEGLVNWLMTEGSAFGTRALNTEALYWGDPALDGMTTTKNRPFNKEGNNHLSSFHDEAAKGAIRSTKFTLGGTGVISFLMGGASQSTCYVAVCSAETDEELYKVTFAKTFSDPLLSRNMLRHYVDASSHIGEVLYIKVVDGATADGYAAIDVDDFKVNLTEDQIAAQMKADYERTLTVAEPNVAAAEQAYYSNYDYPGDRELTVLRFEKKIAAQAAKAGTVNLDNYLDGVQAAYDSSAQPDDFTYAITGVKKGDEAVTVTDTKVANLTAGLYTVGYSATYDGKTINESFLLDVTDQYNVMNGGFETGNLAGWTAGSTKVPLVNNNKTYFGASNMPYNQSGNYHLGGMPEHSGVAEADTWTVKSASFVLGGAGLITVKMGGHAAAVKIYMVGDDNSEVQIGYYKQSRFKDEGHPDVSKGSWNDMAVYVIDLADYKTKTLRIELCDEEVSGWANANFDDVITYYAENVTKAALLQNKDTVQNSTGENITQATVDINWVEATNETPAGTIVLNKKVEGYAELDFEDIASFNLANWIKDKVEAIVIGVQDAEVTVTVKSVKEGETDKTSGFTPEAGKTYTVTYTVSYEEGEGEPVEITFTLKVLRNNDIHNGGFETGDLSGWTFHCDTEGVTGNAVSGNATFWGEKIPYNKSGRFFFEGTGDFIPEKETWYLKSSTFTLGGSGFITFKMGGRTAEVRVFKADGTQIATFANNQFKDENFPYVGKGSRLGTMTTFVADLSTHIGEEIYLELHDTGTENWGVACFDDIVTYYETAPVVAEHSDTVTESNDGDEVQIPWVEAKNTYTAA